ncbi:MAG: ABC transporter substrate-binding protein [Planctomycetaceae bacterium]
MNPVRMSVLHRCTMILLSLFFFHSQVVAQDSNAEPPVGRAKEEQTTLPRYPDMVLPEAVDLLRAKPFDWIVLKSQEVLVVDPVSMRPDPITRVTIKYDIAQQMYNRMLKNRPYKIAEIESVRQYSKNKDQTAEADATETRLKEELENARERADALKPQTFKLPVTLRDGSVDPEYVLDLRLVETVIHFEDLILRRADQLIADGRIPLAYDLLLLVARRHRDNNLLIQSELETEEQELVRQIKSIDDERATLRTSKESLTAAVSKNVPGSKVRLAALEKTVTRIAVEIKEIEEELRAVRLRLRFARPKDIPKPEAIRKDDYYLPAWPRFDETYQKLIFKDADLQIEQGRPEAAFRLLEDLTGDVPGLSGRLGKTADLLISPCVERQDFRQARHFINRLATRDATNPVIQKWKDELTNRALAAIKDAQSASAQGQARQAIQIIDRAALIWPETPGLKEAHRDLNDKHQILRVGVLRLASEPIQAGVNSEARERIRLLTESTLFEPASVNVKGVRYRSSYIESWEPTDLGRRVLFRLKMKRTDWESRSIITAADVFDEIAAKINPESIQFDERMAGYVDGITVHNPSEFSVIFRQLPLRPEAVWRFSVGTSEATRSLNQDIATSPNSGRDRFSVRESPAGQMTFGRVRIQPAATRQRRVEEITEVRYDSWDRALQGLLRGEVSMLPNAEYRDLKLLQDDGRFFVLPYAIPRTHFLLFNPRTKSLQDGQLRRALLHGVPRERLRKSLVEDSSDSLVRLITCPFPSNSYGYSRQLAQFDYDPPLSAALAQTAKKQMGGTLPVLKMICPNEERIRGLSLAMIEDWRRIGITVKLLNEGDQEDWDICYRTSRSVEPLTELWPLLTLQSSAHIDAIQALSEPTRRGLLELERSNDGTGAVKLLHRLLADLLIEARYIPLWELDEHLVARKHVSGLPDRPIHTYDDIERWNIQSWYPSE